MGYKDKSRVTESELQCLMKYAKNSSESIIELGVLKGGTTEGFAIANSGVCVVGIDLFQRIDASKPDLIYQHCLSKYDNAFLIVGDYNKVAKYLDVKVGLVFVDGCHDYESVRDSILLWAPKLVYGGYIAFHDAHDSEKKVTLDGYCREVVGLDGVGRAVKEMLDYSNELHIVEIADSLIVVQKSITKPNIEIYLGH